MVDLIITGLMFLGFAIIGMSRADEFEEVKEMYDPVPR